MLYQETALRSCINIKSLMGKHPRRCGPSGKGLGMNTAWLGLSSGMSSISMSFLSHGSGRYQRRRGLLLSWFCICMKVHAWLQKRLVSWWFMDPDSGFCFWDWTMATHMYVTIWLYIYIYILIIPKQHIGNIYSTCRTSKRSCMQCRMFHTTLFLPCLPPGQLDSRWFGFINPIST